MHQAMRRRIKMGLCVRPGCHQSSVTEMHCRPCAEKHNAKSSGYKLQRARAAGAKPVPHGQHLCRGCLKPGHNVRTCTAPARDGASLPPKDAPPRSPGGMTLG